MMAAGNPNWWSMHPQFTSLSSSSSASSQFVSYGSLNPENLSSDDHQSNQDFPVRSWSQLLMGTGLGSSGGEEERFGCSGPSIFQQHEKKLEINWEDEVMNNINISNNDMKQEAGGGVSRLSTSSNVQSLLYHEFNSIRPAQAPCSTNSWNTNSSSPTSCVTTITNNKLLSFSKATPEGSSTKGNFKSNHHNYQDHSSECNSNNNNRSNKKARVQHESSSGQPALKVRKEKLGDRITALHQLVSPFGKTDTASVLSEAIGYIRFLESQIQALSSPYMRNTTTTGTGSTVPHQQQHSDSHEARGLKDLRSRGLCLVPLSCTQLVGNDNGADYWAPAALGGGF